VIRSAVLKLTFAYLVIIMALSIAFSITLYRISDTELNHGLRKPGQPVFRETSLYDFEAFRNDRLQESRASLKSNLVLLNIITLGAGFAASYLLARKTLEPIEEAMESQARFTADASHELRTPLTAMQTEIEVALRDQKLTKEEAKELLASNLEEVVKLRILSDGLLRLARQKNEPLTNTVADIEQVAQKAIDYTARQATEKQITIKSTITKKTLVKGDTPTLTELISILIDNAIKYSEPKTNVTISAERKDSHLLLRVADQGMGIAEKDAPHVFERFYRADASRTKKDVGGYGLGLSIARKLTDLHKGSIEIETTSKKGTTFKVTLLAADK
jgi:signal transduction histidine kinase